MCNLSRTPHSSLEKDNSLNQSCFSPKIGCLEYITKNTASMEEHLNNQADKSYLVEVVKLYAGDSATHTRCDGLASVANKVGHAK